MDKKTLTRLYKRENLSMAEIAIRLKVTHARVYYWFKKFDIKRRTWSESGYIKQNPNGDPFKIKSKLSAKEKQLLLVGLMLYWAEGNKRNRFVVQIANLDNRMLEVFIKFLRKICKIDERRVTVYVRVHKKFDMGEAQLYWKKRLHLPRKQVYVYAHADPRSNTKKQWSKYGIATLQVGSVKLKQWLDNAIEEYLHKFEAQ